MRLHEIIYIPDIFLNHIIIDRSLSEAEIDETIGQCYTGEDFLKECKGHSRLAKDLLSFVDWQHPDIEDLLDPFSNDEEFISEYGFSMDEVS